MLILPSQQYAYVRKWNRRLQDRPKIYYPRIGDDLVDYLAAKGKAAATFDITEYGIRELANITAHLTGICVKSTCTNYILLASVWKDITVWTSKFTGICMKNTCTNYILLAYVWKVRANIITAHVTGIRVKNTYEQSVRKKYIRDWVIPLRIPTYYVTSWHYLQSVRNLEIIFAKTPTFEGTICPNWRT